MRKSFPIAALVLLFAACSTSNKPEQPEEKIPEGKVIRFTETDELFPNPERGAFSQTYFTSADLNSKASATIIEGQRTASDKMTLYLHSYYLTDYMESDIPQEFLDRLETNMNALREGGAKVVLRFSYKSSMDAKDRPWNATPEWVHRHIDQITPYLQKHADVILCVQCGLLGSWGEWYYTDSGYKMNPTKDSDFELRWEVLEHMLRAVPEDRQVALRIPSYKMRYLKMRGDSLSSPLTAEEAYKPTAKARICGHNDCFVSSSNDVGTYLKEADKEFWAADTKYTFMGGETCEKCASSKGEYAISQMEKYHWSYVNRAYRETVTSMWRGDGSWQIMLSRLGYRLALDSAIITEAPQAGQPFDAWCYLHNSGFAAPMNKRGLELVFVSLTDPEEKYVYPQTEDPRFWMAGESQKFKLTCTLDPAMHGDYNLYMNLPDPYPSLYNDPRYSIRLANDAVWDEQNGYNHIAKITVE